MNANNNNQTPCANAFADNAPNCVGIVAVGNEHGLCSACETKRRQDALDDIFARHNMSAVGGGGASGAMNLRTVMEQCERCHRDIYNDQQAHLQRVHTVREEDGEPMVEDLLVCEDCDEEARALANTTRRVVRRTAGGRVTAMPTHRGVDCTVCGRTIYDSVGTVCSGCVGEGFNTAITATVVQPAVEAVAVQAVTPLAQHDDCCCCLGNDATAWTKMACGHEVCSDCHTSLRNSDVTSVTSRDAMILGFGGCQRDVICPLCRAQNASNDPVELHQRLDRYRKKVADMTESNRKSCDEIRRMARVEADATRRACDAELKRLRDIADGNFISMGKVIEDLKRQLAEAKGRPPKTCDGCSKPKMDDRVPYCDGCMTTLYGENWAEDNGLVPPTQKVGGGGQKCEARADEMVAVRQQYKPDISITRAEAMAIERQAGMGGARAVLVGGGGGGAPTPRRPCRTPNCETVKPTQRRCDGRNCRANNRDTPCCKRCVVCPACR